LKSMEKEEVKRMADEINKGIETLKESIDKKADIDVLEEKFTELTEKFNSVAMKEDFSKQQDQLDEISTQLKQLSELQTKNQMPIREQIQKVLKSDEYKAALKAKHSAGEIFSMELKAASIDTDDINSGTIQNYPESGVGAAPWRPVPVWDLIPKGTISAGADQISWWEETTLTESAEMVTENAAPSSASAKTWTKQTMDIKMIKDYTKVSRSALEDWEYTQSEVNDLLQNGIPRKRETEIISGAGTGVHLKGLTEYAKTFAKPDNFDKVVEPNDADVLNAAYLQVVNGDTSQSNKAGFIPTVALVNPGTVSNMIGLKRESDGTYLTPPFVSADGLNVLGMRVIPSLDMTAGTFLVGDFSRAMVFVKRNLRVSFHYENEDDVLNDLVLVLASQRLAGVRVKTPETFAFVYGTFSSAKSLIEKVTG